MDLGAAAAAVSGIAVITTALGKVWGEKRKPQSNSRDMVRERTDLFHEQGQILRDLLEEFRSFSGNSKRMEESLTGKHTETHYRLSNLDNKVGGLSVEVAHLRGRESGAHPR